MSKHSIVRWIKIIVAYLLVAAVAALGWLWCALPEQVYLEPEQPLMLPRFGWVEPLRGHGSRNVASTRAAGSYQTTLALGGWLPVKTIRATVMQRPTVTVCGTPFGVKMFSEGALVVGFSEVHTAAGTVNPAKQAAADHPFAGVGYPERPVAGRNVGAGFLRRGGYADLCGRAGRGVCRAGSPHQRQ